MNWPVVLVHKQRIALSASLLLCATIAGSAESSEFAGSANVWRKVEHPPKRETVCGRADVDFGPYIHYLQKLLKANWHSPRGQSIKILTAFRIDQSGNLSDLRLASHGPYRFEKAALEAVRSAAPFKPLPQGSPPKVDIEFTFDHGEYGAASDNGADFATSKLLMSNLERAEKVNDSLKMSRALLELARYEHSQQRTNWSVQYYERALVTFRDMKSVSKEYSQMLFELAQIYLHQDQFAKAEPLYRECLKVSESLWEKNNESHLSYVAAERGRIRCQLAFSALYSGGRIKEVAELFDLVIVDAGKSKPADKALFVDSLAGKAHCFLREKDYDNALTYFHCALSEALRFRSEDKPNIAQLKRAIADCYLQKKQMDVSLAYYRQAEKNFYDLCNQKGWTADLTKAWQACCRSQEKILLLQEYELAEQNKVQERELVEKAHSKAYGWLSFAFAGSLVGILINLIFFRKRNAPESAI